VLENQFRRYFETADRTRGITGETLLQLLERRSTTSSTAGLATSRAQARQLVRHGHFLSTAARSTCRRTRSRRATSSSVRGTQRAERDDPARDRKR
jgi:small subunit ribosomal protein S4